MRKMISYALFASMAFLASCSQDETLEQANHTMGVLSFTTTLPNDHLQTRSADTNVQRYIMQLYADYEGTMTAQYLNPDGADDVANYQLVQSDGTFTIDGAELNLAEGTTYTAVFWADYDEPTAESPTYNADYLNCVQLNSGKEMTMAYCGSSQFTFGADMQESYAVTLKRAVAQVNFNQSTAFTAKEGDQLVASYTRYVVYDALNVCVYPTSAEWATKMETITTIAVQAGEKAANTTLGSVLVFASANESITENFNFTYNGKTVGSVSNVPLQANYQTNISGSYALSYETTTSFNVTTDDVWNESQNSAELIPGTSNDAGTETGDGTESGETTEDGSADAGSEPLETVAPVLGDATITSEGLVISYSIPVTHEVSLAGGWGEISLYLSDWTAVSGVETQYPSFGTDAITSYTMSGTFTVPSAGTYIISCSACLTKENYAYRSYEITVSE